MATCNRPYRSEKRGGLFKSIRGHIANVEILRDEGEFTFMSWPKSTGADLYFNRTLAEHGGIPSPAGGAVEKAAVVIP